MNLEQTIKLYGGGPGSGPNAPCPQCGPGKGGEKAEHELTQEEYYEKHAKHFNSLEDVPSKRSRFNKSQYDRRLARAKENAAKAYRTVVEEALKKQTKNISEAYERDRDTGTGQDD